MNLVSGELQFCYPPTLSTLVKKIQIYAITSRIWFADFLMVVSVDLIFHVPFKIFTK